jgi:hypothetical protein
MLELGNREENGKEKEKEKKKERKKEIGLGPTNPFRPTYTSGHARNPPLLRH